MLYKLIFKDGYLDRYVHTYSAEDTYELNPLAMEQDFINCYKLVDGVLWMDEQKKASIIEEQKKKEQHKAEVNEQTLRLAEMFVDMGIDADDFMDRIDAQMLYTALMTDTLLEEGDE